jgi:DNA-binding IclR family transcriptional regulator
VERALHLVDLLAQGRPSLPLSRLAEQSGLSLTTVHRLLGTLMAHGLVEQDPETSHYRLGLRFVEIAMDILARQSVRSVSYPTLARLGEECKEVVHLGIMSEYEVVYVEKIDSYQTLRMYSQIGRRSPMHCTGLGKAILAFLPPRQFREFLKRKGCRWYTEHTFTDPKALAAELAAIRERGYALDDEEHEPGIRCVAAPVFGFRGDVVAAVSVAGPTLRLDEERIAALIPRVTEAAATISARLGYRPGALLNEEAAGGGE